MLAPRQLHCCPVAEARSAPLRVLRVPVRSYSCLPLVKTVKPVTKRAPLRSSQHSGRGLVVCCSADAQRDLSSRARLRRSLWTALDAVALLGSVGGALAALLGVVSPTYALLLPLVLPVVSLVAALQREDIANEEGARVLSELRSNLGRDTTVLLREASAAVEEVRAARKAVRTCVCAWRHHPTQPTVLGGRRQPAAPSPRAHTCIRCQPSCFRCVPAGAA